MEYKFGISTKSENVNLTTLHIFWAHKPKHFLLWKFSSNSKKPSENAPQEWAFYFFGYFLWVKISTNLMSKDLQLKDVSIH